DHLHVGLDALLLHVGTLHREHADARHTERRAVDQADAAGADDEAARRLSDQLAQAKRAEGMWKDLCVAVRTIVDQQDGRLGPLAVVRPQYQPLAAEAVTEKRVLARAQVVQD